MSLGGNMYGVGQNLMGQGVPPGLIWRGAGWLGSQATMGLATLLPQQMSNLFIQGLKSMNFSGFLGQAFANAPLAGFRLNLIKAMEGIGDQISKDWNKADQAAYNYAKTIGLAKDQAEHLRKVMIEFANSEHLAANFGKSIDEIIGMQMKLSQSIGRNIRMTQEQVKSMLALGKVVGDDVAIKFSTSLDKFGLSATQAGDIMTKMWQQSVAQGLSLETYAKNVNDNLHLAQQYGFKKGIDGLTAMAERAAKIKMDMASVARVADKLSNVESVVNTSASLQVLGGPFAQFANPFGLLHDSLNDLEGLSERLAKVTESMAHFNTRTGTVEMGAFNRMRLREFAQATGMDYGKVVDTAMTQAKRKEIDRQMVGLSNIPDEFKELIRNSATFENGVAGIPGADGRFKALSKLETNDLKNLVNTNKSEAENIADIAQMLRGAIEVSENREKAKSDTAAKEYAQQAEGRKGMYEAMAANTEYLKELVRLETAKKTMDTVSGIGSTIMQTIMSVAMVFGGKGRIRGLRTHAGGGLSSALAAGGLTYGSPEGEERIVSYNPSTGTYDSIASNEYVIKTSALKKYGVGALSAVNEGRATIIPHGKGGAFGATSFSNISSFKPLTALNGVNAEFYNINGNPYAVLPDGRIVQAGRYSRWANSTLNDYNNWNRILSRANSVDDATAALINNRIHPTSATTAGNGLSSARIKELRAIASRRATLKNIGSGVGTFALAGGLEAYHSWQDFSDSGETITNRERAGKVTAGKGLGAGAGSLVGGKIGAIIGSAIMPGVGTLVGGLIGAALGGLGGAYGGGIVGESTVSSTAKRSRKRGEIEARLQNNPSALAKFRALKGSFSPREYDEIANALSDGEMYEGELSKHLVEKLKMDAWNGQFLKANEASPKKYGRGGRVVGRTHGEGGVIIEAENNEEIVGANASRVSSSVINDIQSGRLSDREYAEIKAKASKADSIRASETSNQGTSIHKVQHSDMRIVHSGNVQLMYNGEAEDIMKVLRKNGVIKQLAQEIRRDTNVLDNTSLDKHKIKEKYLTI